MLHHYEQIRELLHRVRSRWKARSIFLAAVRASLAASAVLGVVLILAHGGRWAGSSPIALAAVGFAAFGLVVAAIVWGVAPLRHTPSDARLARFIEERTPSLDDRLVSAVDLVQSERYGSSPAIAEPMLADAARRAGAVDLDQIVPIGLLRRAGVQAAAAVAILVVLVLVAREPARQTLDAASLALFPSRVTLEVTPGSARIKFGTPLAIEARLVGNRAPIVAQVQIGEGDHWRASEMTTEAGGTFRLALESVTSGFNYRVVAGTVTSPTYAVTVARAPRVTRIDVDYTYPDALRLEPRTEEDSGDIYAPPGTDIRLRVHTDRPAASGQMALGDGRKIALTAEAPTLLATTLKVVDDNSYRVALADLDGFTNPGETEYFIRTLEDRPPDVHIVKPASDRAVTRLEEVDIEAQADDDYGIDTLEFVYSVRGSGEQVVPLDVPRHQTTVSAHYMLSLEDLNIEPGDFVSYYVRARDVTRGGKRSNEARSDIFFLDVRPFEQQFTLSQSESMSGSGKAGAVDDLVNAQKQVVVATWKLDRRKQTAKGSQSEQDFHAVARTEADIKARVEQTSSTFRQSSMRDPRQRPQGRGAQPEAPKAGQTLPEEDAMATASAAMGKAVTSLDALKTGDALPPEMLALNLLLKAQAAVKKQEVPRQQSGQGGAANNNRNYDISTLFDKELKRTQQTNYETSQSTAQNDQSAGSILDKIKDLAQRQDELLKRQQELAREQPKMSTEELKRQLETLTRDQSDLRQRAEELAQQMSSGQQPSDSNQQQQSKKDDNSQQSSPSQQGQQSQQSQQNQQSQQSQGGQQGQQGQSGAQSQSGQQSQSASGAGGGERGKRMREVSEQMRNAASDLRRQNPAQASVRGSEALEKLRELARQMQASRPDDQRRALGEMQLEARQVADAQREVASELRKVGQGEAGNDATRRLAGEEERLADRVRRLQEGLKQQTSSGSTDPKSKGAGTDSAARASAGEAARDLERERLAERMQKSADEMRVTAAGAAQGKPNPPSRDPQIQASGQQDMARTLDKLADKLGSTGGARDAYSRKLSEQLTKAQELRDRMKSLSDEVGQLGKQNDKNAGQSSSSPQKTPGESGKTGEGQQSGNGGNNSDLARLSDEYTRQLEQTRELVDQLRRDNQNFGRGGAGFTFEDGQKMTLSAPGTEAFKQDFAKWEVLRRQATQALENVESSLSKQLQAKEAHDRLAAGVDDKAPPEYQQQVDSYFKALATKKKP